jgi:hypothetical protein
VTFSINRLSGHLPAGNSRIELAETVIAPAEAKVKGLAERRRMIEAELTKPP